MQHSVNQMKIINYLNNQDKPNFFFIIQVVFVLKDMEVKFLERTQEP